MLGGYHEIFENKKPQINADERGFMIAYQRLFAFICGFLDCNTKAFYNLPISKALYSLLAYRAIGELNGTGTVAGTGTYNHNPAAQRCHPDVELFKKGDESQNL